MDLKLFIRGQATVICFLLLICALSFSLLRPEPKKWPVKNPLYKLSLLSYKIKCESYLYFSDDTIKIEERIFTPSWSAPVDHSTVFNLAGESVFDYSFIENLTEDQFEKASGFLIVDGNR